MSNTPVRIRRKNNFNLFREGRKLESFDEFPMLRPEVDPQVHVSRNSVDQPFLLTCEKDTVIAQISGAAKVEFASGPVRYFDLIAGDFVYVPAGAEHRVRTTEPGIQIRYKALAPGQETVSWSCESCGQTVYSESFDATSAPAQIGYHSAVEAFNNDAAKRKCASCNAEHPPIDMAPFRWVAVAEALLKADDDE